MGRALWLCVHGGGGYCTYVYVGEGTIIVSINGGGGPMVVSVYGGRALWLLVFMGGALWLLVIRGCGCVYGEDTEAFSVYGASSADQWHCGCYCL